jgi:integrase
MARHIRNPKIESRAARAKLKRSAKPTYFDLGGKLHLGYRKGKGAGRWVMRVYIGGEKYTTQTLAEADDLADANGFTVLNFDQAQDRARECMNALDDAARIKAFGPVVSVADAAVAYEAERGATARDARGKLKHLIADAALAATPLAALTAADLAQWRAGLLDQMREASARRVVNDAKACLNAAVKRHAEKLPPSMRDTIRNGLAAPRGVQVDNARERQILTVADVRRLVDAALQIDEEQRWDGDLGRMVLVLAATGARFSQVARLRVGDLQVNERRLMMPVSKKGSGAKASHVPVQIDDDVVRVLERATAGRRGSDPLLMRPRWRRAAGPELVMEKYGRGPWSAASTLTRPWKVVVERAGLPKGTIPYAFRHSSIVRGLRAGLPTQMVAKLHDTSSTMIERYYGRFISDALHELARAALVPLMPVPVAVVSIDRSSRQ